MWKQKIGISVGNEYSIPTAKLVKMLKKIGFDAVSPEWEDGADLDNICKSAIECGLFLQSIHAPIGRAADLWSDNPSKNSKAIEDIFATILYCEKYKIPVAVVHYWIGFDYTFNGQNLYFENFDKIVEFAKEKGVKIAFENTEGEEYLFALMEHFKDNDTVGYCWDSGHEMCYNHSKDLLAMYGDRLLMTHLNDNLGISRFDGKIFWTDDLHLLPFDGIADWDYNVERLKKSKPLEFLNFELSNRSKPERHDNDCYEKMELCEYFTEAYKRACKIAYKYSK